MSESGDIINAGLDKMRERAKPDPAQSLEEHLARLDEFRKRSGRGPNAIVDDEGNTVDPNGIRYLNPNRTIKPVDWLVDGWVSKGDIVLLAGRAGGGKSTTAVDLALAVAMGNGDGWMGGKITNAPVIYLDEEAGPDEITRQFQRQTDGEISNLFIASGQRLRLDSQASIDRLEHEIREKQPGLIVLDTATHFWMGADANDAEQVASRFLPLFALRDAYQTSFLILHHMRKPPGQGSSDDPIDRVRGSGAFVDQASTVWTQQRRPNTGFVDLTVCKRRGGVSDRTCRIERMETFNGKVRLSFAGESEKKETESVQCEQVIAQHLREHYETRPVWRTAEMAEVGEAAGFPQRTVERALGSLRALGVIEKVKQGFYRLVLPSKKQPEMDFPPSDENDGQE